jgi:hypothetical protein
MHWSNNLAYRTMRHSVCHPYVQIMALKFRPVLCTKYYHSVCTFTPALVLL